jgi:hypothetical protein
VPAAGRGPEKEANQGSPLGSSRVDPEPIEILCPCGWRSSPCSYPDCNPLPWPEGGLDRSR